MTPRRTTSKKDRGPSRKTSLFLFGLAGLGVGVWVFRSRRSRRRQRGIEAESDG